MLELHDIAVRYGSHAVLDGVSAVFAKGRLTSIIGVNGCGKSTLLKAMLGILPVERGEITLDGHPLSAMQRTDVARRIAYLPQDKATPDMTVMQMVLHGRFPHLRYPRRYTAQDRDIAQRAMQQVGIAELADRPLRTLSGGMRQTAYIAMALAADSDYILLDEPTTHLDIAHQLALIRILRSLADSGKGIVTVMHDLPMAFDFSDETLLLSDGRAAIQDSPRRVCAAPEIEALFGVRIVSLPGENRFFYQYD